MNKAQRSPLLLMALTILIDFTGFGIIIPLLPFWAEHLGANSLEIGLLMTTYGLAQFLFTPLLGSLSDRYGRKPIIVISILIESAAFVLTAIANTLPLLLLARFIGGIGASNIGSAQAVVADVTEPKDRARGMGMIGAAIGLGFVIGPALGGVLAGQGTALPFWVAAAVALLNALLVLFLMPETRKPQQLRQQGRQGARAHGISVLISGWRTATPTVLRLTIINLFINVGFTAMEAVFPLFAKHTFGWNASHIGYIFTYVGVIIVVIQGGLIRRLVKIWSEQTIMLVGLALMSAGLIMLAFSTQLALLLIALGILSAGNGTVMPTISTLFSFASSKETQGETLGLAQGVSSLGRIVGPLLAGSVYALNPATPFIGAGILVALALVLALPALPKTSQSAPEALETSAGSTPFESPSRGIEKGL